MKTPNHMQPKVEIGSEESVGAVVTSPDEHAARMAQMESSLSNVQDTKEVSPSDVAKIDDLKAKLQTKPETEQVPTPEVGAMEQRAEQKKVDPFTFAKKYLPEHQVRAMEENTSADPVAYVREKVNFNNKETMDQVPIGGGMLALGGVAGYMGVALAGGLSGVVPGLAALASTGALGAVAALASVAAPVILVAGGAYFLIDTLKKWNAKRAFNKAFGS